MKLYILTFLLVAVVIVECKHTFMGTNVDRPMAYHHQAKYSSNLFRKRVENLYYSTPGTPTYKGRIIQGIMAFDLTNSGATANVTRGGVGHDYVNFRMKSDRGKDINFDIYIYV